MCKVEGEFSRSRKAKPKQGGGTNERESYSGYSRLPVRPNCLVGFVVAMLEQSA